VDLVTRVGMSLAQAVAAAKTLSEERRSSGFDQAALDTAARKGLANGAFEDSVEEGAAVVEEFFPAGGEEGQTDPSTQLAKTGLAEKLAEKARKANVVGVVTP
jgi:hypothetical protein